MGTDKVLWGRLVLIVVVLLTMALLLRQKAAPSKGPFGTWGDLHLRGEDYPLKRDAPKAPKVPETEDERKRAQSFPMGV